MGGNIVRAVDCFYFKMIIRCARVNIIGKNMVNIIFYHVGASKVWAGISSARSIYILNHSRVIYLIDRAV